MSPQDEEALRILRSQLVANVERIVDSTLALFEAIRRLRELSEGMLPLVPEPEKAMLASAYREHLGLFEAAVRRALTSHLMQPPGHDPEWLRRLLEELGDGPQE